VAIILNLDPDWPLTEKHPVYWAALGRFVHRFALLERQIHYLLQLWAGMKQEPAQVLLAGVKASAAVDMIPKLRASAGRGFDEDLKRAFEHYKRINSVRNLIVHFAAILERDAFVARDGKRPPHEDRVVAVQPDTLDAMTDDLQTIAATLFVSQCEANGAPIESFKTDWREVGRAAFRFNPADVRLPANLQP
jgi:hypothetical protein